MINLRDEGDAPAPLFIVSIFYYEQYNYQLLRMNIALYLTAFPAVNANKLHSTRCNSTSEIIQRYVYSLKYLAFAFVGIERDTGV